MDGDCAPLMELASICERFKANLVVDEVSHLQLNQTIKFKSQLHINFHRDHKNNLTAKIPHKLRIHKIHKILLFCVLFLFCFVFILLCFLCFCFCFFLSYVCLFFAFVFVVLRITFFFFLFLFLT